MPKTCDAFEGSVKKIKRKVKKGKLSIDPTDSLTPGVVYIGHLPHGFFEPQLKRYFTQFGKVTRLRLSRSNKTGNSKGYAYVEFECDSVAKIVADSMNNYLMFDRLLKCQYVPPENLHRNLWIGASKVFKKPKAALIAIERHNKAKDPVKERLRLLKQQYRRQKKLKSVGIDYSFDFGNNVARTEKSGNESEKRRAAKKSVIPVVVDEGDMLILEDHPSDAEIDFKTPPNVVKMSRLNAEVPRASTNRTPDSSTRSRMLSLRDAGASIARQRSERQKTPTTKVPQIKKMLSKSAKVPAKTTIKKSRRSM
ncbi:PREDICTED: MKI67 FHA domain-interacting nucleolar phosphoprotein-like [Priapulus caudatus]|uniref:MKI67 FHA domain-interacting nucleolar phosphoprotein-like n=1 Tax=Priapulus caudatus TaxID=37621 RepID=A0ABM1ENV3_PRICU|nr:PREDICTED: MKI67 FHA domain-interacting nucleolar phosphoprotein-like [Priapulus caudatus]